MKSVVIGGSGFLGSYVVDALQENGFDVWVLDRTQSNYFHDPEKMIVGEITDPDMVNKALRDATYVFHFAGVADIYECSQNPVAAVTANILGTTNVLEACVKNEVQCLVFASSLYVQSRISGIYGITKRACEELVEYYFKSFGLNYTILRFGTVYGQRSDDKNSIYKFINQAINRGKIIYPGDGSEVREYIHALDAARQTVAHISEDLRNKKYLITGNHPMEVANLFKMIKEVLGNPDLEVEYSTEAEGFDYHYKISPYAYQEDRALKVANPHYIDLGQGILDLVRFMKQSVRTD